MMCKMQQRALVHVNGELEIFRLMKSIDLLVCVRTTHSHYALQHAARVEKSFNAVHVLAEIFAV